MTQPYKLWHYSVSHGTLLIRKPGEQNHDHVFYGVETMDFTDGLYFDTLEVSMYEVGANPGHYSIYDLEGTYNGEEVCACVAAYKYKESYNNDDMFEIKY